MTDLERDLRDMMNRTADGVHHVPRSSHRLVRRARLRRVRTSALTGAAAVALVIGGFAGVRSLSTERGSIQPADDNVSPSEPTPSEAWTGPCADSQDGPPPRVCLGPLEEGTYTSQRFEPALTFTVPAGWNNPWDTRGSFDLWTPGWSDGADDPDDPGIYLFDHPGFSLFRDVRPWEDVARRREARGVGCSYGVDAAAGTSALELATWVDAHPGIAANAPSPVEVGGLSGYQLDVSIAETWKSCRIEDGQGPPSVPLFDKLGLIEHPGYATMRLILLDLPDGGNVLIAIDGEKVDAAMPVVHSFEFDLS
jgi:hypothetical protein